MSKHLKILLTACLAACMAVCLGIFAAACNPNDGNGDGSGDTFPSSVSITVVLDDDTPVKDVWVGICIVKDDGSLGACLQQVATNAQGVATIAIDEENGKNYEIHLSESSIPAGYLYADANGDPYGEAGVRIDVTKNSSYTVKLTKAPEQALNETVVEGLNPITLNAVTDVVNLTFDVENAGWYRLNAINAFDLSGEGFELTDSYYLVIYVNPDDEMTLSFSDNSDLELNVDDKYSFNLVLTALEENGSETKPLLVSSGYNLVLNLDANETVYVENDPNANYGEGYALEVSGTNFKANYESINYTETFTLKAPEYDGFGPMATLIPSVFTVGTADGTAGVVTLTFNEHVEYGSEANPYVVALNETVTAEVSYWDNYFISFTATEDGDYTVNLITEDTYVEDPSYTYEDLTNFHLNAGETITFFLGTNSYDSQGERSVSVSKL
ncbi:MAG: hypothetical protein K2O89_00950 [Clostridia bacterium]|nr:hypothetical protein [Clostridia bacterium]